MQTQPNMSKQRILIDAGKFALLILSLAFIIARGMTSLGYHWQWYRVPRYLFAFGSEGFAPGPLLEGLMVTLRITAVSMVLAFLIGLATVLLRLSGSFSAQAVSRAYLELIRNTPLLIQLFFLYFVISPIVGMDAYASAVLALSLFEGAYISEIIRSGILGIPNGQWEAALSSGMNAWETYRMVILPQAVRNILPPLTSQAISLIKDSALVSTIAIYDLTMQGQAIVSETFLAFEIWLTVAFIYLTLTITLSMLANGMEKRLKRIHG